MPEIRFRKLKIAWTLGCCVILVMLSLLWVRSYSTWDRCFYTGMNRGWQLNSMMGQVVLVVATPPKTPIPFLRESLATERRFQNTFDDYVLGFFFQHKPTFKIGVPFWFLFALILGLAGASRMQQFSLRILLVFMSLVAIVLAIALYAMNRAFATSPNRRRGIAANRRYTFFCSDAGTLYNLLFDRRSSQSKLRCKFVDIPEQLK